MQDNSPMADLQAFFATWLDPRLVGEVAVSWGGKLLAALAIFLIGRLFLQALTRWATSSMRRVGLDDTLNRFLGNLLYVVLLVFLVLTALQTLGVPAGSFFAIVGAAGLAVGLALKDSLSNFSSGVMLIFFRPFKVGDQIEAAGVSGVVESIGMFDVVMKTPDNRVINVPNSLIYGGAITNYNAESTRRIDLTIAIGYDADIPQAKSVIAGVVAAEARVAKSPAPEVAVQEILPAAVTLAVRAWVATPDYGAVRSDLLERCKRALDKYGLSIPAVQRVPPAAGITVSK
jgi:small conductance mechanosensitive channel